MVEKYEMDSSDPLRIAFALIEKLPDSIRINKMIRKIRKVFPIIFNSPFTALAVNSSILAG
jgi:hypothetical protein